MRGHWLLRIWLVVVWVALWGNVSAANVASGILLALLVPAALPGAPRVHVPIRPLPLLRLAGFFVANLVRSTIDVARLVVLPRIRLQEAVLAVPLHDPTDDLVATVVANSISLTPGTLSLEVEDGVDDGGRPQRTLYVHVLDLGSPDVSRSDLQTVEYMVLRALGRDEAIATLADPRARPSMSPPAGGSPL